MLPDGRTTGLRPWDHDVADAAWAEVTAAHPIHPSSRPARLAWMKRHLPDLRAVYARLLAESDGLVESEPRQGVLL